MHRFPLLLAPMSVLALDAIVSLDLRAQAMVRPDGLMGEVQQAGLILTKRQTVPRRDRGGPADSEGSGTR